MLASAVAIKSSANSSPFTSVTETASKLANKPALTPDSTTCSAKEALLAVSKYKVVPVLSVTTSSASAISTSQVAL